MNNSVKIVFRILIISLFASCRQEYVPKVNENNNRLLVVEGFLNSGLGATTIHLSRTTANLSDTTVRTPELNAQVSVEGDDGSSFLLTGNSNGDYSTARLTLANNVKYRVHIKTIGAKDYVSEFTPVKHTPPIDSISWQRENDGVQFYAHAHDPQNASTYYQWKYEETWEYHSAYHNSLKYILDASTNRPIAVDFKYPDHHDDTAIYKCWKTLNSTSIILGSTENLTADVVYLPVHYIEAGSEKLSVLYSLYLKQYALSHDAYLFYQKMKKNTEQLGTLFDPQPSQLSGNIHCLTDPYEIVIGYIEVNEEQTMRIFLYKNQVSDWNYDYGCFRFEIVNNRDSIAKYVENLMPGNPSKLSPLGTIDAFFASTPQCIDCTIGRTNQKPSFWP